MALVYTLKGILPSDVLEVVDVITLEDNARVTATEWYLGEGDLREMVRRDVWVSALRPLDGMEGQQASM